MNWLIRVAIILPILIAALYPLHMLPYETVKWLIIVIWGGAGLIGIILRQRQRQGEQE